MLCGTEMRTKGIDTVFLYFCCSSYEHPNPQTTPNTALFSLEMKKTISPGKKVKYMNILLLLWK